MTIRDVIYGNDIDVEANIRIGLYSMEKDCCAEYNPDNIHDKDILDDYLDCDITYITIRRLNNDVGLPYIYMEATID